MRHTLIVTALLALAACNKGGGASGGPASAVPQTEDQKTFYALGLDIGEMSERMRMRIVDTRRLGEDVRVLLEPVPAVAQDPMPDAAG